ncbi:MAG: hypothetical protein HY290_31360, partial [Planctomycetia bacterium]|nr:hypothetical protein [Planctomycetia bacterium]
ANPGVTGVKETTGDTARGAEESSPSAEQLFQKGKEQYFNRLYAESVASLEAAEAAPGSLSASDRDRLQNYLGLARARAKTAAPQEDVVVRGQSGDPSAAAGRARYAPNALNKSSSQINNDAAKQLIAAARKKFNEGNFAEAERLAKECKKLGGRFKMYGDSPEKLLEEIKSFKIAQTAWKNNPTDNVGKKMYSNALLVRAREMLEQGDYANAERTIREAEQIQVTRGAADLKPEMFRQDLARRTKGLRKPTTVAQPAETLTADAGRGARRSASAPAQSEAPLTASAKRKPIPAAKPEIETVDAELLPDDLPDEPAAEVASKKPSRPVAEEIDEEPAPAVARKAKGKLEALSQPAEDEPAPAVARKKGNLETLSQPADDDLDTEPAPKSRSIAAAAQPDSSKSLADRVKAMELLNQAQTLLESGRPDEARAKVQQAEKLDVAYDVLGLTPEYLVTLIDRAERDTLLAKNAAKAKAAAAVENAAKAKAAAAMENAGDELQSKAKSVLAQAGSKRLPTRQPAAAADDDLDMGSLLEAKAATTAEAKHKQAQELTRAADAAYNAGLIADAKSKAAQAQKLDAAYDLLEKTPEDVLESAARAESPRQVASKNTRHTATRNDDDAPAVTADKFTDPEADDGEVEFPAVNPSRVTANELYQRGKNAIRSGDTALAVQCYMQAYQSGERLDPRKAQEIREFLSQHHSKSKKIHLLTSRQVQESDLGQSANEQLPRKMIDTVGEHQQVAVDKLRNEVRNASFRAEQLAATDPTKALEALDKAQVRVENSGLDERITGQLIKQIGKSRENIETAAKLNAPRIEMAKRKGEIESIIKREEQIKVRVDQEFAEKVEKYNQLLREKRFDEAVVLAKEAELLKPADPIAEAMLYKAKYAKQIDFNKNLKSRKDDMFTKQLNDVDESSLGYVADFAMPEAKRWKWLTEIRDKYRRPDNRMPTPEEIKIERSLSRDVSLHFNNAPLSEVIARLRSLADVNIVLDPTGLEQEGINSNTNVAINVDSIKLKSVLNLLLEPLSLGYTIKNDVLMITSHQRQQGDLQTKNYPVADLVMPIRDFSPVTGSSGMVSSGYNTGLQAGRSPANLGQLNVASAGGQQRQSFAQIDDREARRGQIPRMSDPVDNHDFMGGGGVQADFTSLMNLISQTVQPDSWEELSGPGSMVPYRTTLSLVIRQTQAVHDEIADLLGQLRRLQDLQVTIECRFITVSDTFFERIGIDFNFNLKGNVNNGLPNTFGQPLPPFGNGQAFASTQGTSGGQNGQGGQGGQQQGQGGQQAQSGTGGSGGGGAPFTPGPPIDTHSQSSWPRYGNVVGLLPTNAFANNLDIPFSQGSFGIGVPQFGSFNPAAGMQVGFAILSDIETFFLINAAQGDNRSNLLFAPKVTLFNGQTATVTDTRQRPFVTSLIPTVGFGSVGFTPQITVLPEGVSMTVTAVISADRRYVRLTVIPSFTAITDVQQFSFVSGAGNASVGGGQGGGQNAFGGGQGG